MTQIMFVCVHISTKQFLCAGVNSVTARASASKFTEMKGDSKTKENSVRRFQSLIGTI